MSNSYYNVVFPTSSGISIKEKPEPAEMPKAAENLSVDEIQNAYTAMSQSYAYSVAHTISNLAKSGKELKDWEIQMIERAYAEFAAKYKNPLIEALK